jgi:membrane protein
MAEVAFRNSIWGLLGAYALIASLKRLRGHSPAKSVQAESMADGPLRDPQVRTAARPWWWAGLLREAATRWFNHNAARLGAALAFYAVFSIGPVMVIAIAVAGFFFGADAAHGEVSAQLTGLLGDTGAKAVEAMLAGAGRPAAGIVATLIGIITLLLGATGVVVQLKDALNTVWDVEAPPGSGIWNFLRTYIISLAGVLALGFLLLLSLLITTALSAGTKYFAPYLPEGAFQIVTFLVAFSVTSLLFAMMFKWLPDVEIGWRDVWLGAVFTAALFEIGKFLIGFYIGKQGLESTYGAAASIVVLLIWVYYSAQIVLLGAEFTYAYATQYGSKKSGQKQAAGKRAT